MNDAITTNYNTIESQIDVINTKNTQQDTSITNLVNKNVIYDASFVVIQNDITNLQAQDTLNYNSLNNAITTNYATLSGQISTLQTKTQYQSASNNNTSFTGNLSFTGTINSISNSIFSNISYLNGLTQNIASKFTSYDASFNSLQKAYFQIGTVETLNSGQNTTASITGTIYNSVLNLSIPKGDTGATGATGARGATGSQGEKGDKGDKGDTGAQGDSTAATISAGIAAASATAAVASAAASAASAGAAAASAALAEASVAGLTTELQALETRVITLESEMDAQQLKTTNINYVSSGVTQIAGTLETSYLNVDGTTNIGGNLNIASTSTLYVSNIQSITNSVEIGTLTSAVYINGVLYNPLSNFNWNSTGVNQW